jgi:hypothetical protein
MVGMINCVVLGAITSWQTIGLPRPEMIHLAPETAEPTQRIEALGRLVEFIAEVNAIDRPLS